MHQVAAQLLKNETVHTINGPWWLIQMWLNLYMHKIIKPNLQNLSFPSSNFDEEYRGEEGRTHQCMNYGETASAITVAVDVGHLFKKFYRGFDADILTCLPLRSSNQISSWPRQNIYRFLPSRQPSNLWVLQPFFRSSSVWSWSTTP